MHYDTIFSTENALSLTGCSAQTGLGPQKPLGPEARLESSRGTPIFTLDVTRQVTQHACMVFVNSVIRVSTKTKTYSLAVRERRTPLVRWRGATNLNHRFHILTPEISQRSWYERFFGNGYRYCDVDKLHLCTRILFLLFGKYSSQKDSETEADNKVIHEYLELILLSRPDILSLVNVLLVVAPHGAGLVEKVADERLLALGRLLQGLVNLTERIHALRLHDTAGTGDALGKHRLLGLWGGTGTNGGQHHLLVVEVLISKSFADT